MLHAVRRPLRPNWWTILPVLASVAIWGGIVYVGALTNSALDQRSEQVAALSAAEQAKAGAPAR